MFTVLGDVSLLCLGLRMGHCSGAGAKSVESRKAGQRRREGSSWDPCKADRLQISPAIRQPSNVRATVHMNKFKDPGSSP